MDAQHSEKNIYAPPIIVGTTTGHIQKSSSTCRNLPTHLPDQLRKSRIFPNFNNSLVGISPFCDVDFKVLFTKDTAALFDPEVYTILTGWREIRGARLWQLLLCPEVDELPPIPPSATATTVGSFSAYYLPSVGTLVHYFHTYSGCPFKSTCIAAIKEGNYSNWPGLTYTNAVKYFPYDEKTVKGHLTQTQQCVRSTKPNPKSSANTPSNLKLDTLIPICSYEMHIWSEPIYKLYTDDTGQFSIIDRSCNQYIPTA